MIKHHNRLFQQPPLRQALYVPDRRLCKDVGLCRIQICKFYDLRCAILKIKPQLTPFAVVVRLIQVDRGGDLFVPFAALGLLQRHGMDKPAFQQLQAQLVKRPPVESLRATGGCTLEIHRQVLIGGLRGQRADTPAGHADGIPLFQIKGRWRLETIQDMRSSSSNPVSGSETSIKIYGSKEEIRARKARKRLLRLALRQTHLYR